MASVNVLQLIAVVAVRIAVGIIVIVIVVIVRRTVAREERDEMPEMTVAMAEMPKAAALHPGKSRAGRHSTGCRGKAPSTKTAGPETAHAGETTAAKASASEAATVESTTAKTSAAVKAATTSKATVASASTAARKRERGRKRADCCHSSKRNDKFLEHRSTPQNYSLHGRYNSGRSIYIRRMPSHSRNEISAL